MENLQEFVDGLNEACREENKSLIFHRTKFDFLDDILKNDGLLPPNKQRVKNSFYVAKSDSKYINNEFYDNMVFVSLKSPDYTTRTMEFKQDTKNGYVGFEVCIIIDPYTLNEDLLEESHFCEYWNYGKFVNNLCVKYDKKLFDFENIDRWSKFISFRYKKKDKKFSKPENRITKWGEIPQENIDDKFNELVIYNPEGVSFSIILTKNPNGVIIVINTEIIHQDVDKKVLMYMKRYPQYQWLLI